MWLSTPAFTTFPAHTSYSQMTLLNVGQHWRMQLSSPAVITFPVHTSYSQMTLLNVCQHWRMQLSSPAFITFPAHTSYSQMTLLNVATLIISIYYFPSAYKLFTDDPTECGDSSSACITFPAHTSYSQITLLNVRQHACDSSPAFYYSASYPCFSCCVADCNGASHWHWEIFLQSNVFIM